MIISGKIIQAKVHCNFNHGNGHQEALLRRQRSKATMATIQLDP